MPSDKYWSADEVLVQTLKKNYTVKNYDEFFTDLGLETAKLLRNDTKDLVYNITAPGRIYHASVCIMASWQEWSHSRVRLRLCESSCF